MGDALLTKDAEKMIAVFYKEYLHKRKAGASKNEAKCFHDFEEWSDRLFPCESKDDVLDTQFECCRALGVKPYHYGGFTLNDNAIAYMEQQFPSGIKQVLEFLGAIKNVIPFA